MDHLPNCDMFDDTSFVPSSFADKVKPGAQFEIAFNMGIKTCTILMIDNLNGHIINKFEMSENFKLLWRRKG